MITKIDDITDLCRKLIQTPSESGEPVQSDTASPEKGVLTLLQSICQENDIRNFIQEALPGRFNFMAHFPQPGAKRLLLAAHQDTVSAKGMENPFAAEVKDGKIWGRGACDDKGPLATALATLLALQKSGKKMNYDVLFAGTVDEENTMSGAKGLAQAFNEWDLCIGFEPTGLQLINTHKGVYRCRVTCHGKAAHSSTPHLGENAIDKMVEVIADLEEFGKELRQQTDPVLGSATMEKTKIKGGTAINIIPDQCSTLLDIRLLPDTDPAEVGQKIREIVGDRGEVKDGFMAKGIRTDAANPHVVGFQEAIRRAGGNGELTGVSYATDCSQLNHIGPCLVWGPGNSDQAHQAVEFIEIEQMRQASAMLEEFLLAK